MGATRTGSPGSELPPLPGRTTGGGSGYYVYVVELDDAVGPRRNPRYPAVYVGQSAVPPRERFRQHKDGYRSSRYVRRHGKHLRPLLYRHFNPIPTRDQALAAEQELAKRLRNRGYTVYGGH